MQHTSPLKRPIACAHRFKIKDQSLESQFQNSAIEESPSFRIAQFIAGPVILTASPDYRALSVYSLARWQQILPKVWRLPKDNESARQFMITLLGKEKHIAESDEFVITTQLRNIAGLEEDAVMLDFGHSYAEIWSEDSISALHKQALPTR